MNRLDQTMKQSFLDQLLKGSSSHRVERTRDGIILKPLRYDELAIGNFQHMVNRVRARELDGYRISREHEYRDHGSGLVDSIWIEAIERLGDYEPLRWSATFRPH